MTGKCPISYHHWAPPQALAGLFMNTQEAGEMLRKWQCIKSNKITIRVLENIFYSKKII